MRNKFRLYTGDYLIIVELATYTILAMLLSAIGLLALAGAGKLLWEGVSTCPWRPARCRYWTSCCWF